MIRSSLPKLARLFDAFLVDQFGVLLDGKAAYPWAAAALSALASTGKPVILLSNSGKRSDPNAARLLALGFERASFQMVLSSGEAAYRHLSTLGLLPGTPVWLHARDGDESAIAGLGFTLVDRPEDARLLILAGSQADVIDMPRYIDLLGPAAERKIAMLCTNPDLEMLTPMGPRPGAGRIATLYADLGGPVEWIGKPYPLIYSIAADLLQGIAAKQVLCIGDSPAHDILGGRNAGFSTALVRSGLHASESDPAVEAICRAHGALPDFILDRFEWREA